MTHKLRHKAKMLIIELESLRNCKSGESTIETFNLLEEVLKDAGSLAKQVKNNLPGTLEERIAFLKENSAKLKVFCHEASERSRKVMGRSREILARHSLQKE
jgi:ElaB/YqjD/DUF883 family membrane-anchored ribosome-binding protein